MLSWRTASVALLSFSSGLPLGLVWISMPDWMRSIGVDIRLVGLLTIAQTPWTLKFLWSPLLDRYQPPFWGRRRGYAAIAQIALCLATMLLAGVGSHPDAIWVAFALSMAIALAAASQDIAIDAYAVEVLRPEEHGIAVGARVALYRAAMLISGGVSIWLASHISWRWTAIVLGLCYVPMLIVSKRSPEPETPPPSPRTLRDAVWLPFLECLSRHRAMEILAFVVFYKLADSLSQSLLRPFLIDLGYDEFDRGLMLGLVGVGVTLAGTFLGGIACNAIGVGPSLWIFGVLQIFSNVGYIAITSLPNRPVLYAAMFFELLTTGLGMGAFGVMLLRMTRKQFSATQYALFSSLFSLPRILAGPVTGFIVFEAGWRSFFYFTMVAGIPGLILLQRFSPIGLRDPDFQVAEEPGEIRTLSRRDLFLRGTLGGLLGLFAGVLTSALLGALKAMKGEAAAGFDLLASVPAVLHPDSIGGWITLLLLVVFAAVSGLFTAAVSAARHGGLGKRGGFDSAA